MHPALFNESSKNHVEHLKKSPPRFISTRLPKLCATSAIFRTTMDKILDLSPYLSKNPRKPKRVLPFKCDQCEYSVRYQCQLKEHAKVHLDLKPLACPVPGCSYATKWKHSLANHKTVHEDETTVWYKCEKCDFKTKYKYVLEKRHAKRHIEGPIPRRYKCDVCEYGSDSRPSFLEHRKHHNKDVKRLTCDYEGCEFTALWKCNMFQHKKRYHSNEILWYKCNQCNYKTQDKHVLRKHFVSHSEERPFSCPYLGCGFKSKTVSYLRSHQVRLDHFVTSDGQICEKTTTTKRYQCTISGCKFSSNDSGDLKKHLKIHDPNRKRHLKCPLCSKSFFDTSGLKAHIRYHTYEKSFLCSFSNCDYKSIYPSEVTKHERIHVAAKMFACTFEGCEAKFKMAYYLKTHLLCHDPEGRPKYTCNLCSLEFVTRCGLRNHISLHTNEKAYKCADCGYSTAKSYEFKRHECAVESAHYGVKIKKTSVERAVPVSKNVFQLADGSFGCRKCDFTSKSLFGVAAHSGWAHPKKAPRKLKYRKNKARRGR